MALPPSAWAIETKHLHAKGFKMLFLARDFIEKQLKIGLVCLVWD